LFLWLALPRLITVEGYLTIYNFKVSDSTTSIAIRWIMPAILAAALPLTGLRFGGCL